MLAYAFDALGLHAVMLEVHSHNERAIRAYRSAEFTEIGRRRESVRLGSVRFDEVYMECIATNLQRNRPDWLPSLT